MEISESHRLENEQHKQILVNVLPAVKQRSTSTDEMIHYVGASAW